jgi:MFS family permease
MTKREPLPGHATPRAADADARGSDAPTTVEPSEQFRGGMTSGHAWYAVAVLTLANISGTVDRQIFSSLVKPIKRDFGLTDTQISLVSGFGFAVFFSLFGLVIGRWVDSRRRTTIVAVGATLWSMLTALTGVTRGYGQLLLSRIGVGVGEATLGPSAVSIIADAFPRGRLGRAMSVYMMGSFLGSGVSYALGSWLVSVKDQPGFVTLPIVGAIHPWQTVFFIIGLPGLLVALLMLTVREPERTAGERAKEQVPVREVIAYMRRNARTMTSLCVGFTFSASVNWGVGFWLQSFLVRTHQWSVGEAGLLQGVLTWVLGPMGALFGGWLFDRYARRGVTDGPLRIGMMGAAGMIVFAGLYPIVPSAALVVALLVPVNIFAALPWGAANAAIAEAMPSRMRGQGSAVFQLMVGLAGGIGPTAVALVTDRVYGDDASLRWSLTTCTVVGMSIAFALFAWGRPAYRATVAARDESRERAVAGA